MKILICGHRPQKLGKGMNDHAHHAKVKKFISEWIGMEEPELVYTGMAIGVDQWAAEACIAHNIPFVAAIPFKEQYRVWPQKVQDHYHFLLKRAATQVLVDRQQGYISAKTPPDKYASHKLFDRNRWMVDQLNDGDQILAIAKGTVSGTYNTLAHASARIVNMEMAIVNPDRLKPVIISGNTPRTLEKVRLALCR